MKPPLLSVRDLRKTYPSGVTALSGLTFDVQPGEFLVVIGLSGSGKSTLLKCINRLTEPTAGQILFEGAALDGPAVRKKTAMVFQNFNLVPRFSVLTNVLSGGLATQPTLKSLLFIFSDEDRQRALEVLKIVGLADKAHTRADQLSGGQQQRVAIARALFQRPRLLLADEPVASLDPATSHSVMDYIRKANRELGITVICNLHFLALVREYGTRVLALQNGRIVFEGTPAEIDRDWFRKIYGEEAREI